ncbi:hypothetical protein [Chromatium okenii]|nr:hypothetical protein [Chromatium okenii]
MSVEHDFGSLRSSSLSSGLTDQQLRRLLVLLVAVVSPTEKS